MANKVNIGRILLASSLVVGFVYGCGDSAIQSIDSFISTTQQTNSTVSLDDDNVTLYFDGQSQSFSVSDLAVATALFINPNATTAQIQQIALDIFGLTLAPNQVEGAGNPISQFDLNGDGIQGGIQDLGVALAVFLGERTQTGVNRVCQDILGQSCDMTEDRQVPTVAVGVIASPNPGGTPVARPTPSQSTPVPTPQTTPPPLGVGGGSPGGGVPPEGVPGLTTIRVSPGAILFPEGTGLSQTSFLTISPTVAPRGGDLVVRIRIDNTNVIGFGSSEGVPRDTNLLLVTIPENSTSPETIVLERRLSGGASGNTLIFVERDPSTTATNFTASTIAQTTLPVTVERSADDTNPDRVETIDIDPRLVTFAQGTGQGSVELVTLTPSSAPLEGNLVVRLRSSDSQVLDFGSGTQGETLITFPEGSSASRVVALSRRLVGGSVGNALVEVTRDTNTTARNFSPGSINDIISVTLERSVVGREPEGVDTVTVEPEVVNFPSGTTVADALNLTVIPSSAPVNGNLVLRFTSTNPQVVGFRENAGTDTITLTIPQGSSSPQTIPIFRQILARFGGNSTIRVEVDRETTATNFPPNSVNRTVIVRLEAGEEPPFVQPEEQLAFNIDQLTFTAENFIITQSDTTAEFGYGPLSLTDNFGPRQTDVKFTTGPQERLDSCRNAVVGVRPFFVTNEETGEGIFLFSDDLTPDGAQQRIPVVLAGQGLRINRNSRTGTLSADISPGNQDELYRLNFFTRQQLEVRTARCVETTSVIAGQVRLEFNLVFEDTLRVIDNIARGGRRLLTLRGTPGGNNEPDQSTGGRLFGAQTSSDRATPLGIAELRNPRFSGVQNVFDAANNQVRTDISLIFDQIFSRPTQAALLDQPFPIENIDDVFNPSTGSVPNVNSLTGLPARQFPGPGLTLPGVTPRPACPATATNGIVCGRFQFNQPFSSGTTPTSPDTSSGPLLVIDGFFVGKVQISLDVEPQALAFDQASPVGDTRTLTIAPTVAPEGGNLVIDVEVDSSLVSLSTNRLTFPAGSIAPQTVTVTRSANLLGTTQVAFRLNEAETTSRNLPFGDPVRTAAVSLEIPAMVSLNIQPQPLTFPSDSPVGSTQLITVSPSTEPIGGDLILDLNSDADSGLFSFSPNRLVFPQGSRAAQQVTVTRQQAIQGAGNIIFNTSPNSTAFNMFADGSSARLQFVAPLGQ